MSRSEIFDNYIKIALESGLIKEAEKSEHNPRYDSLSVKEIANLYNVKNEKPADMEYKRNIIEDAHPEPVVLFRSHDKINSLIENVNERQNIIINILRKMPNGNLVQKKYAESELALSLVRVANEMDIQDKEELRILADTCAVQLKKKGFDFKNFLSEKGGDAVDVGSGALSGGAIGAIAGGLLGVFGGPPAIVAGAALGAAAGGALAAIFKTSPQAKNLAINAEIARHELGDLIQDNPSDPLLHQLDAALLHVTTTASQYAQLVDRMHLPTATNADKSNVQAVANKYFSELSSLSMLSGTFLVNAKSGRYAPKEADWWAKVKTPFTSIFGDDVADEVKALETLQRVIRDTQTGINTAVSEAQGLAQQATQTPAPAAIPTTTNNSESDFGSMMDDAQKEMESWLK